MTASEITRLRLPLGATRSSTRTVSSGRMTLILTDIRVFLRFNDLPKLYTRTVWMSNEEQTIGDIRTSPTIHQAPRGYRRIHSWAGPRLSRRSEQKLVIRVK